MRCGDLLRGLLVDGGRLADEAWTPLCRDLAAPVADRGVRIEVIGPERADVRVRVQRPVGVHRAHRGHGYGTAITVAAAAALREMGFSSATVCTESSNVGAVATCTSAGFRHLPEVRDLCRPA